MASKKSFRFRLQTEKGRSVLNDISSEMTYSELKSLIADKQEVKDYQIILLSGYPPKSIDGEDKSSLTDIGLKSGETLTVKIDLDAARPPSPPPPASETSYEVVDGNKIRDVQNNAIFQAGDKVLYAKDMKQWTIEKILFADMSVDIKLGDRKKNTLFSNLIPLPADDEQKGPSPAQFDLPTNVEGVMVKREIDSDNSCLFNAVANCIEKGRTAKDLREIIAKAVRADNERWSEAVLGRFPEGYARKILLKDTWGGSVELAILATHYSTEMAAVDISSQKVHIFGQNEGYKQRIYLLYDGIHYDVLAVNLMGYDGPPEIDVTVFSPNDQTTYQNAIAVAGEMFRSKKFTDVYTFSLQCEQCGQKLAGQGEAKKHNEATGHSQFCQLAQI